MEFLEHTLDNGLQIVAERNPQARSLALGFFVQTGARDENDALSGVSHFLEHMVFKGTQRRSADDVNRRFDELGAHYNAFTSEEHTVYYAAVLPEYQSGALDLLADILRPALRSADFATEKQVILEEIRMYLDQPPYGADDRCRALHYGGHPLGRSVLGTPESIAALSVEQMRAYFAERYCPQTITLVAAGQTDFDQLVADAQRLCGDWPARQPQRFAPPPPGGGSFAVLHQANSAQQYALRLTNAPAADDSDRYAAKLLATILGDEQGSRLYWQLVDPGLAEHASLSHSDYQGAGLYLTYLSCDPEVAADNLQRIHDVFQQVATAGVLAAELSQAKNKVCSRIVLSSERPQGRLFNVGGNWLLQREYRTVQQDLRTVDALTLDDINRVSARFPLTEGTTVTVGPLAEVPAPR